MSLWLQQAHTLAPLCELIGNKPFVWDKQKEQAFKEMKALMAANCINKYPNYTKTFHIYTNASDYQLGAAIIHLLSSKTGNQLHTILRNR